MEQLTLRGFDPELEEALRGFAQSQGLSLNRAALELMRKGAGLTRESVSRRPIGHSLDRHFGTMTPEEARELERGLEIFEEIDDELWS